MNLIFVANQAQTCTRQQGSYIEGMKVQRN